MEATEIDPLSTWKSGVSVRAVDPDAECHSIHAYFNACPESPDGRYVMFFRSRQPDGEFGEICVIERATGKLRVLVSNVTTEDGHRVAAQQWVSGGRRVAFQDRRDGEWLTAVVDVETGEQKVLARGRLLGFSQPSSDVVPLYGPHWNPGPHRDLELANVATGEITTIVTNDAVRQAYPQFIEKHFKSAPTSIFFPELSPDGRRIFFKMSSVRSGDPRRGDASERQGMIVYDIAEKRFLNQFDQWGHPYWHPDSRRIIEFPNVVIDVVAGTTTPIPGVPYFSGSHPSISADGRLLLSDVQLDKVDGKYKDWGVVVADMQGSGYVTLHRFPKEGGATSWRVPHPHPVFSADGKRIYFNLSAGPWTRLHVIERK